MKKLRRVRKPRDLKPEACKYIDIYGGFFGQTDHAHRECGRIVYIGGESGFDHGQIHLNGPEVHRLAQWMGAVSAWLKQQERKP